MNRIIASLHKIYQLRFSIRWYSQYRKSIRKGYYNQQLKSFDRALLKRSLVIAPHSDDEWIGASTIIRNSEQTDVLYMEYYGDSYDSDNIRIRQNEISKSSVVNGFTLISVDGVDRKNDLTHALLKNYTSVFVPSYVDWHPEHRETFFLFSESYLSVKEKISSKIFLYNISVPNKCENNILYMMPMTRKEQRYKWKVFNMIYPSQYMPIYRYKLQERIDAYAPKMWAAELFEEVNVEKLSEGMIILSDRKLVEHFNAYKQKISNILSIREAIFE